MQRAAEKADRYQMCIRDRRCGAGRCPCQRAKICFPAAGWACGRLLRSIPCLLYTSWKGLGYNCIIYYATLVGIDRGYYEAAVIDGANRWQQILHITLPALKPTIITLTLMAIGKIFYSDFGLFYQVPMNSGPLLDVTNTIDTYVYRGLMSLNNISMASAAGVYQSLIGFLLVLVANFVVKKLSAENALF